MERKRKEREKRYVVRINPCTAFVYVACLHTWLCAQAEGTLHMPTPCGLCWRLAGRSTPVSAQCVSGLVKREAIHAQRMSSPMYPEIVVGYAELPAGAAPLLSSCSLT
eukprot:1160919-Pelagomonas_calceolata.AAC.10